VDFAARAARHLSEAQFRRSDPERLGRPPADREGVLEVSLMAATTHSVHFYDSVVVFEKRPKTEPWHEIR
jgi:hypothetical protein